MNWQPIETAPKDGTLVDLWVVKNIFKRQMRRAACWWYSHDDDGGYWKQEFSECLNDATQGDGGFCLDDDDVPTHWMPLPAAPLTRSEFAASNALSENHAAGLKVE